ncbi:MAG: tetratricopeptide repeat protein [Hyphomicrobiaceae bacterium]|nr:tetratricopeptide repeat protein [Hyphomicrobiaceae bacterium]
MRKFLIASASILAAALSLGLGGCSKSLTELTNISVEKPVEPVAFGTFPSERLVDKGKHAYRQGDYGIAADAYAKAVEEEKENAEAWLGLAASYDRLKRFDQAKRAYDVVVKLVGQTPTVLNNLGYHYYLKGDMDSARRAFDAALRADPGNVVAKNNLTLFWEPTRVPKTPPRERL